MFSTIYANLGGVSESEKKGKKCDDVIQGLSFSYFCGQANQNTSLKDACEPTEIKKLPKVCILQGQKRLWKGKNNSLKENEGKNYRPAHKQIESRAQLDGLWRLQLKRSTRLLTTQRCLLKKKFPDIVTSIIFCITLPQLYYLPSTTKKKAMNSDGLLLISDMVFISLGQ